MNSQIEKTIKQHAKKVLTDQGINATTKRGNKELRHLLKRLAQEAAHTPAAAVSIGTALGETIAERSKALGKQHLDGGVVRQIALAKDLTFAEAISLASPPVEPVQPSGSALISETVTAELDIAEPDIAEPDTAEPEEMDIAISEVDEDDLGAAAAEGADPVELEETAADDAIEVAEPEEILEEDEIEAAVAEPELEAESDDETEAAVAEPELEAESDDDETEITTVEPELDAASEDEPGVTAIEDDVATAEYQAGAAESEDETEAAAADPELVAEPDDETEVAESEDPLEAAGPEDEVLAASELEDETTEPSEIVVGEAAEDNPSSSDLADPDEMDATATAKPIKA